MICPVVILIRGSRGHMLGYRRLVIPVGVFQGLHTRRVKPKLWSFLFGQGRNAIKCGCVSQPMTTGQSDLRTKGQFHLIRNRPVRCVVLTDGPHYDVMGYDDDAVGHDTSCTPSLTGLALGVFPPS